ncbi:site-specific DNA-methyltransferase [Candidatus Acetothermia bacterium]|nr:site-specific DNA-methyltransferase [Candidatus Acetothermia bacterium]
MVKLNHILNMDAREGLKQLEDSSVDCVVTSPPYWGLRHYKTEPQLWDGNPKCQHEWQDCFPPPTKNAVQGNTETVKNPRVANSQSSRSFFCSRCEAWQGELGLEPTFELYIKHLCDILDEVKRVLKKEGTCWVNIADTYAGSWGAMPIAGAKKFRTGAVMMTPPSGRPLP